MILLRFDEILLSKSLPTYQSMILRAIEAGHQVDLLYHAAKSLCESDLMDNHPVMMASISFADALEMSLDQAMRGAAATYLAGSNYEPIATGWRLWTASSEQIQLTEIKRNEFALLCSVHVDQKCFHAEHLVMQLPRIFKFAENAGRTKFSFLFFVQGIEGLSAIGDGIRQPPRLTDDNIVAFYQDCSCQMLSDVCLCSFRGFGEVVSRQRIQHIFCGA